MSVIVMFATLLNTASLLRCASFRVESGIIVLGESRRFFNPYSKKSARVSAVRGGIAGVL